MNIYHKEIRLFFIFIKFLCNKHVFLERHTSVQVFPACAGLPWLIRIPFCIPRKFFWQLKKTNIKGYFREIYLLCHKTLCCMYLLELPHKWVHSYHHFIDRKDIPKLSPFASWLGILGQVVQSVVSLTSSLRVISLTVLADSIHNILIFFAEKMWVAFALQKLLTFFQQKISAYLRITQLKF